MINYIDNSNYKYDIYRPFTWEFLKQFNNNPPDAPLHRNENIQIKYTLYMEKIKQSLNTTILKLINKCIHDNFSTYKFIITYNDFPYDVDDSILHLVLWVNPKYMSNINEVCEFLKKYYPKYIIFKNKTNHQSIPEIEHYQLFIYKKNIDIIIINSFAEYINHNIDY